MCTKRAGYRPRKVWSIQRGVEMSYEVAIVDDDPIIREMMNELLQEAGFAVQTFAGPDEFLNALPAAFHCILLDERMRPLNGVETFEKIRKLGCDSPVLMVTGVATAKLAIRAMDNGFASVLQKPFQPDELIAKVTVQCEAYEEQRVEAAKRAKNNELLNSLSEREKQVLRLVAQGYLNKQIAATLKVGLRTVETYRNRVMQKIGAKSAADAIAFAISVGMRDRGMSC